MVAVGPATIAINGSVAEARESEAVFIRGSPWATLSRVA
jgi:hypothetical protein